MVLNKKFVTQYWWIFTGRFSAF